MDNSKSYKQLLPHLFRQEYAKMTAVLCRHFGLKHIEVAEDIASDTFLKASEYWAINGVPDNATAWLYTVAKNKAKDYFKHISTVEKQIKNKIGIDNIQLQCEFEYNNETISDSQLQMIFAVCHPRNSTESQIALALQILCGFSVEEIANAFLTNTETIKKRLLRARANLRNNRFQIKSLDKAAIDSRLEVVLKTIYLLFNEGYFSKTYDQHIRRELCSEAVRLALILTENSNTNTPNTNALLALMCFQSSRLDARLNDEGEIVLFDEQDRTLWDKSLIEKGNYFLVNATNEEYISRYHLEAGIAYWHVTPTGDNKWQHILQLYNKLLLLEYSPVTAWNRVFAFAKVHGCEKALAEVEKLTLTDSNFYHELLGFLYTDTDVKQAIYHYEKAINLTKSGPVKAVLIKQISRLKQNSSFMESQIGK